MSLLQDLVTVYGVMYLKQID